MNIFFNPEWIQVLTALASFFIAYRMYKIAKAVGDFNLDSVNMHCRFLKSSVSDISEYNSNGMIRTRAYDNLDDPNDILIDHHNIKLKIYNFGATISKMKFNYIEIDYAISIMQEGDIFKQETIFLK